MRNPQTMSNATPSNQLPGHDLRMDAMPGHWVLAQMGKRVLRPGGIELTRALLSALNVTRQDRVVELAPGLGITARITLSRSPASYTAVERDPAAAAQVQRILRGDCQQCVQGTAERTGLPESSQTVVYGEAMLTMQTLEQKKRIVQEVARILQSDGRYGLHEICLIPEEMRDEEVDAVQKELSQVIRTGARPLKQREWCQLLLDSGFQVETIKLNNFHLLEPWRMVQDEGIFGVMKILLNMIRNSEGRRRVLAMRRVIRKLSPNLKAMMIVAWKV